MNLSAKDPLAAAVTTAIREGQVTELQRLLRDHTDLATARIVDESGVQRSLLHVVADWPGHFPNGAQTVAVLVAAGANVDAQVIHPDPQNAPETPLHWAASSNDVAVLDALLDGGANIEAPGAVFTGGAPMSDAVIFGNWDAAQRLLERGAKTTLSQAAALGRIDLVDSHCQSDRPTKDALTTAFWTACSAGQQSTANFLLNQGAELNWIGFDDKTPLDAAIESGAQSIVGWLREQGAKNAGELQGGA